MENGLIFHVAIPISNPHCILRAIKVFKEDEKYIVVRFRHLQQNVQYVKRANTMSSRLISPSRWKTNSLLPMQKISSRFISPQMSQNFHRFHLHFRPQKWTCPSFNVPICDAAPPRQHSGNIHLFASPHHSAPPCCVFVQLDKVLVDTTSKRWRSRKASIHPKQILFCLWFGRCHLWQAGIRTTTGSLSALARLTPYQLKHRAA